MDEDTASKTVDAVSSLMNAVQVNQNSIKKEKKAELKKKMRNVIDKTISGYVNSLNGGSANLTINSENVQAKISTLTEKSSRTFQIPNSKSDISFKIGSILFE